MAIIVKTTAISAAVVTATSKSPFDDADCGVADGAKDGVVVGVEPVGEGVCVGAGVEVGEDDCAGVGVGVGVDVSAGFMANELLVPEYLPSVAVIVTLEPEAVNVTVPVQTPLEKGPPAVGVIVPFETLKVGVPL